MRKGFGTALFTLKVFIDRTTTLSERGDAGGPLCIPGSLNPNSWPHFWHEGAQFLVAGAPLQARHKPGFAKPGLFQLQVEVFCHPSPKGQPTMTKPSCTEKSAPSHY